jgi:cytoskeletal protein CcmA (bactofilin family)
MKHGLRDGNTQRNTELTAFLEEGSHLEGNLTFKGIVRVNGNFVGKISSTDGLIVGPSAQIEGQISVGSANVGGKIKGEIIATERVEIQASGWVEGSISAPAIVIHEGAQILGEIRILRATAALDNPSSKQRAAG